MFQRLLRIFLFAALVSTGATYCVAQAADNKSPIISKPGEDSDDHPKSFKETMQKLRIEREKKDYDEMIDRGEEALKLSEELEKAYERNGKLTPSEVNKLATVEKLVKKIRSELGGDDDDESENKAGNQFASPDKKLSAADAIKSFRATTVKLFDELKKTTRFTISAAAIQTSNAVLKLTRFLRITN
jgi:hypothetical protein